MKRVLEGSYAVSTAVELARAQVVSAYPITPQTHIVERLGERIASGKMNARFLRVESEHSAMAAVIGAAATGARTFTASSSQGLALMHEMLHWAAGARLPIVLADVNRAMAPGWNIWADQTDTLSQRDTGWIQLYCEDVQEVLDTVLIAYRLAETVRLPVMVAMDAFFLSHTCEPVDIPSQEDVDAFLPPWRPVDVLDPDDPRAFCQLTPPEVYTEFRYKMQRAMETGIEVYREIDEAFGLAFGRSYGICEVVLAREGSVAPLAVVTTGSATGTARATLSRLSEQGVEADLVKLKLFRPFPLDEVRRMLGAYERVAVVDRNISFGFGGIFAQEIRAALDMKGDTETTVVSWAGDGGTFDIGLQALSGAAERNDDILYVCYDNEAYMNTGVQASSSSPYGVSTTTTPPGAPKNVRKKNILQILAAHRIPYAATASIAYPEDLVRKVQRAAKIHGARFLHIYATCPTGWKIPSEASVRMARMAVQSRVFPLYEIEDGERYTLNPETKGYLVDEYLKTQGRFSHLSPAGIVRIQADVDHDWDRLRALAALR